MKIQILIHAVHSKRDSYGNVYWAAYVTEVATGKTVAFTVCGGESNIRGIAFERSGEWKNDYYFTVSELPIRQFNKQTKNLPYGGCTPKELWEYVKKELAK